MGKLNWVRACAVFALCAATAIALPAQTFTALHTFDGTDGAQPSAALIQATDGNLYGTTVSGGASGGCFGGCGTVFSITPSGRFITLYSFCSESGCLDGAFPYNAGLVQGTDGNLYGTTEFGGASGGGTVFKITPSGILTTLHSFCSQSGCTDGELPNAGLIEATDGNFYGTTAEGGANGFVGGTVFKITSSGTLTTLYSFCSESGCTDGADPFAGLVQATDGKFYGTAAEGGANGAGDNGNGTVFTITAEGSLRTLYSFCPQSGCVDGAGPLGLVQSTDGNFYGTTAGGGANGNYGTAFKITPGGTLTTLYSFCSQSGCADGETPLAGLIQATDGNFYGITRGSGVTGDTIFRLASGGTFTVLYSFCQQSGCPDGESPSGALVQDTTGTFYGTTASGGTSSACTGGCGTVFSLSVGLGPFVETQPSLGKVGQGVRILGTNLTGTTSVTFNGTPAVFKVISPSFITATVPAGATSGKVQVVTPSGTLSSNVPFRVRP